MAPLRRVVFLLDNDRVATDLRRYLVGAAIASLSIAIVVGHRQNIRVLGLESHRHRLEKVTALEIRYSQWSGSST